MFFFLQDFASFLYLLLNFFGGCPHLGQTDFCHAPVLNSRDSHNVLQTRFFPHIKSQVLYVDNAYIRTMIIKIGEFNK